MRKGTQSSIQSSKCTSVLRPERRLEKTSSLKTTESIIVGAVEGRRALGKAGALSRSIEQQVTKAQLLCEAVRSRKGDCKTSREDNETAPSLLANFRERGQIIQNHQIFRKLRLQQPLASKPSPPRAALPSSPLKTASFLSLPKMAPKIAVSPHKNAPEESKTSVICKEAPPRIRISSLMSQGEQPLQRLQQVRQIESFVLQEEEKLQVSVVQGHGELLNWGVCMGKASEFKVLKFLDEGKYGKVYLAQSHRNNMVYSIKSIYRHALDDANMQQLIREVKIQSFLTHPHVVRLYHFFVEADSAYLVLEPCLGRNLYQNLRDVGKVEERRVREWVRQVCLAVEHMHRHDVIHRDLKPENILLHENVIKICDFGWAVHSPLMRHTQCGTPLYTPPELVAGAPYDSKIDIWSIGILTYELLYGTIPFEIRHTSDMAKIIEQDVYFSQDTLVSEPAKDFMLACLHKNPADRATIRQLLDHQFLARMEKFRWTII